MTIPYVVWPALTALAVFWLLIGAPVIYWLLRRKSWQQRRGLEEELQLEYDVEMIGFGLKGGISIILVMLVLGVLDEML